MNTTNDIPPELYKYMNADTGFKVLANNTLRWSSPGTLNDPHDMQFALRLNIDRSRLRALSLDKLWESAYSNYPLDQNNLIGIIFSKFRDRFPKLSRKRFDEEFGKAIDEGLLAMERQLPTFYAETEALIANSKILCLTDRVNNVLMWSHYADRHQGISVGFRVVPELDSPWTEARKVIYVEEIPELFEEDLLSDVISGRKNIDSTKSLRKHVYTKSKEWAYENEYRIFSGSGRNPLAAYEDLQFHPLELSKVVFGCRMPHDQCEQFSDLVTSKYPHAEIMVTERNPGDFGLTLKPWRYKS